MTTLEFSRKTAKRRELILRGMKVFGLNFHPKQVDFSFYSPVECRLFPKRPKFLLFLNVKIGENELIGNIKHLVFTNSISQNPIVKSDFWYLKDGTFSFLKMLAPNVKLKNQLWKTYIQLHDQNRSEGAFENCTKVHPR